VTTIRTGKSLSLDASRRKAAIDQQYRWQPRPGSQAHPGIANPALLQSGSCLWNGVAKGLGLDIKAVLANPVKVAAAD